MFTGIIEEIGSVRQTASGALTIQASLVLSDLKLGDSIAVDGTCLTVIARTERTFTADVQPETLRRTTLGSFNSGRRVNLERAITPTTRLGGHLVQGHIDATGRLIATRPDGDGLVVQFQTPLSLMRYIAPKGFIAVNGTSLTVVDVGDDWFTVALVRYTRDHISLLDGTIGSAVNLEVDIIAKYIERLLLVRDSADGAPRQIGISVEQLRQAGFA